MLFRSRFTTLQEPATTYSGALALAAVTETAPLSAGKPLTRQIPFDFDCKASLASTVPRTDAPSAGHADYRQCQCRQSDLAGLGQIEYLFFEHQIAQVGQTT